MWFLIIIFILLAIGYIGLKVAVSFMEGYNSMNVPKEIRNISRRTQNGSVNQNQQDLKTRKEILELEKEIEELKSKNK